MKLIDLLVKELPKRGGWPEGEGFAWQDDDGEVRFNNGIEHDFYPKNESLISEKVRPRNYIRARRHDTFVVTREQYEAAIAKNDGWIEWGGGECPVEVGTMIDVRYRDGKEKTLPANARIDGRDATNLFWRNDNQIDDIIAYRPHRDINSRSNNDRLEQDLNECIGQDVDMPEWNGDGLPSVGTICEAKVPRSITGWEWREVKVVESGIHGAEKEVLVYDLETTFPSWVDEFRPLRTEGEEERELGVSNMLKLMYGPQEYTYREICEIIYDAGYRKDVK